MDTYISTRERPLSLTTRLLQRPSASLARILRFENHAELFKCTTLRLNKEKVNKYELEQIPKYEKYIAAAKSLK